MSCHFSIIAINPDHTQGDNLSITFGQQIPIDPAVDPRNVGVHVRLTELLERPESCASTYESSHRLPVPLIRISRNSKSSDP